MHPIDARTLEIFRTIAETGSATRAAAQLNSTQPSITRAISAFEKQCGFQLFERGRYGMTLTEPGSALLETVERTYAGLNLVADTIKRLREGLPGTLRTVAVPVVAEGALCDILGEFARVHPQVSVYVKSAYPQTVVKDVVSGEIEIGAIIGAPPHGFDLVSRTIGTRRMKVAVPLGHRLANRERIHFRELHGEPFVLMAQPHNIRLAVEAMMQDFGVRPSIVHEVTTQRVVVEFAKRIGAIGFADDEVIESVSRDDVMPIELEAPVSWNINLIYRRERQHSQVFATFLDWLERWGADPCS